MQLHCVARLSVCRRLMTIGHLTKSSVYKCRPDGNWRFPLVPHGRGSTSRSACRGEGGGGELSGGSSRACAVRRRYLIRIMKIPAQPSSRDAGRSRWGGGWGRRCTSARRFRRWRSWCVRACSDARCAHGGGRLIYAVGSNRSARARASSTHGPTNCWAGSRPKAADRSASNALRGSCSIRSARKATPACSIFPGGAYWLES
ncbi:hypothetical protein BLA15945_02436 [Burkholderia lata]|uniref:Uncharacterized protein n=1 Tax=Burkholderia lata (strain ATCC 17760 / DSM 23089 / LMG 22485 / NCIMB 9086 / R18194 / 383) TaxID=482957 RepID=A0A6P2K5G5_BURL3|nr:hypothetical protein BLA15945_02436 [Burkholderia lata]